MSLPLVFTGIPFALTRGIVSLWLRGIPLSISAAVGFIGRSGHGGGHSRDLGWLSSCSAQSWSWQSTFGITETAFTLTDS